MYGRVDGQQRVFFSFCHLFSFFRLCFRFVNLFSFFRLFSFCRLIFVFQTFFPGLSTIIFVVPTYFRLVGLFSFFLLFVRFIDVIKVINENKSAKQSGKTKISRHNENRWKNENKSTKRNKIGKTKIIVDKPGKKVGISKINCECF